VQLSEALKEQREHELTMHVFSISAGMIGVCLAGIGILALVETANTPLRRQLRLIVDGVFMIALLIMVAVCGVIAYAIV